MKKILSLALLLVLSFVFFGCQTTTLPATTTTTEEIVYAITLTGQQSVQVGRTLQMSGTTNKTGVTLAWTSSNQAVATVSASGLVTGVSTGQVTITVSGTGMDSKSLEVTVTDYTFSLLGKESIKIGGDGAQLVAETNKPNPVYNWTSSNTAVATVSASGMVSAVAAGEATISVAVDGVGIMTKVIVVRTGTSTIQIGSTTEAGVNMFSTFWGNNATNADVRNLTFGYGTVSLQMVDPENEDPTLGAKYEIDPTVVKNFEVKENVDGTKTYTIEIQQDLLWSDGEQITAKDYVFPFLLGINPVFAAAIGKSLTTTGDVVGSEDFNDADLNVDGKAEYTGVDLIDEYTFSVTINADRFPYYYEFLYYSVNPWPLHTICPDADVVQGYDGARFVGTFTEEGLAATVDSDGEGYRYDISVTCGPYTLFDFDTASSTATLVINDYYKGDYSGQIAQIENVVFKYVTTATQMTALLNGEIDLIETVSGGAAIQAGLGNVTLGLIDFTSFFRNGYGLIGFHCDEAAGPTSQVEVRQAIAYLINRTAFLATYTLGYGILPNGQYGAAQWMVAAASDDDGNVLGIDENGDEVVLNDYAYNPTTAAALLTAAGWNYNLDGSTPYVQAAGTFRYNADGDKLVVPWGNTSNNPVSDLIRAQLLPNAAAVGMEITDATMDFNTLLYTHYYGAYGDGYLMPEDDGDGVWTIEDIPAYEVLDPLTGDPVEADAREYHMVNLGTGFTTGLFEPYYDVSIEYWGWDGGANIQYLYDEEMLDAAEDMMRSATDEEYLEAWQRYQYRYNLLLPTLPLYSDEYHAFYSLDLEEYKVTAEWTMTEALIYANIGE